MLIKMSFSGHFFDHLVSIFYAISTQYPSHPTPPHWGILGTPILAEYHFCNTVVIDESPNIV